MEATRDAVTIDVRPFIWPITAIIISLIFSVTIIVTANILVGGGFKIGGGAVQGTATTRNPSNDGGTTTTNSDGTVTVSLDDDAVLGNKDTAKVAIVEFSDYECPFCHSFWKDTLPEIEETYIKSGQVVMVYRDLPLSFHEPAASYAANIMECTRDQGGDEAYFKMHDAWFTNSALNGTGIADDKIKDLANKAGLKAQQLIDCAKAETYKDEIAGDSAAASAAGISGTPGFVVGKIDENGNVTGDLISGAYPFDEFDKAITKYL